MAVVSLPVRPARWVTTRRAAVVVGIRDGGLGRGEVVSRYRLWQEVVADWEAALNIGLHLKALRGLDRASSAAIDGSAGICPVR